MPNTQESHAMCVCVFVLDQLYVLVFVGFRLLLHFKYFVPYTPNVHFSLSIFWIVSLLSLSFSFSLSLTIFNWKAIWRIIISKSSINIIWYYPPVQWLLEIPTLKNNVCIEIFRNGQMEIPNLFDSFNIVFIRNLCLNVVSANRIHYPAYYEIAPCHRLLANAFCGSLCVLIKIYFFLILSFQCMWNLRCVNNCSSSSSRMVTV